MSAQEEVEVVENARSISIRLIVWKRRESSDNRTDRFVHTNLHQVTEIRDHLNQLTAFSNIHRSDVDDDRAVVFALLDLLDGASDLHARHAVSTLPDSLSPFLGKVQFVRSEVEEVIVADERKAE